MMTPETLKVQLQQFREQTHELALGAQPLAFEPVVSSWSRQGPLIEQLRTLRASTLGHMTWIAAVVVLGIWLGALRAHQQAEAQIFGAWWVSAQ
jgi:hypothetical protein